MICKVKLRHDPDGRIIGREMIHILPEPGQTKEWIITDYFSLIVERDNEMTWNKDGVGAADKKAEPGNPGLVTALEGQTIIETGTKAEVKQLEKLESLFDLIDRSTCQLEGLVKHAGLINESLKEMIGDTKSINQNIYQAQLGLNALALELTKPEAEAEAIDEKAAAVQAANDAVPVVGPEAENVQNDQLEHTGQENS